MSVDSFRVDSVNLPVCMVGIKSASRVPFIVRIVPSDFSKTTFETPMDNLVFKISPNCYFLLIGQFHLFTYYSFNMSCSTFFKGGK
nr:hypothetical 9.7K protein - phage T4 [Escherichia phage T4]